MEPKNVGATPDNVSEIGQIPDYVAEAIQTIGGTAYILDGKTKLIIREV